MPGTRLMIQKYSWQPGTAIPFDKPASPPDEDPFLSDKALAPCGSLILCMPEIE